jgi:hypothetical protein
MAWSTSIGPWTFAPPAARPGSCRRFAASSADLTHRVGAAPSAKASSTILILVAVAHDVAVMAQRLRQEGGASRRCRRFHPQVHFRVTLPDLAGPSLLANQPPYNRGWTGFGKVSACHAEQPSCR